MDKPEKCTHCGESKYLVHEGLPPFDFYRCICGEEMYEMEKTPKRPQKKQKSKKQYTMR